MLKKFLPKRQQISQCELFIAYTLIANEAECLRDSDMVWYIDNTSAAMAPIKGSSAKADMAAIAVALHAIFARLGVRVWAEYVESASNPADGLSRAGLEDPWTIAQGWTLKKVPCPSFFDMDTATVDSVQSVVTAAPLELCRDATYAVMSSCLTNKMLTDACVGIHGVGRG